MPNWKEPATLDRLLAAIIAANGGRFEENVTYDAIENRTRVYKKQAKELADQAQAEGRMDKDMRAVKSTNGTPRKPRTPKKDALHGVASGRVSKRAPKVKEEPVDGEMGDVHAEDDDEGLA
ncbi:hypothetical protein H2203_002506 [Taxawa tesnikishii (nom. ined.)]|nr:hypothetical protein H2203_002506 [Dothideales sp. JES 119]